MTRARRWLLWGLVLAPAAILPSAFIISRIWLHQQLQRQLEVGDIRIRLSNPVLGWNLAFSADSLAVESSAFALSAGGMRADLRLWNSLASLKPSLRLEAGDVLVRLIPDSSGDSAKAARKRARNPPSFPNLRIPIEFRASLSSLELASGSRTLGRVNGLDFRSDGPKGAVLEASGADLPDAGGSGSLSSLTASFRVSARWFGKTLRYQGRAEFPEGDFLRLEGERPKTDLRMGRDSLELQAADLSDYSAFLPGKRLREIGGLSMRGAIENGEHRSIRTFVRFTAPPVWRIGPQKVEGSLAVEDSAGRLVLASLGEEGESFYLQGHFRSQFPAGEGWSRFSAGLTATLSGFSRGFRFPIGGRVLPGDVEIRRLKVLPGLRLEADLRTRDNSMISARAFRAPDPARPRTDSAWKCEFTGTVSPGETWAHAWVDTNVEFSHARVKGEIGKGGVNVEAWIKEPRAYGAAGDSLYAEQSVTGKGYYLKSSRLHAKGTVWPVTGQVEWKKGEKGRRGRADRNRISLVFRTHHPRHGFLEYSMPMKKSMAIRADSLDLRRLPLARLENFWARLPVAMRPMLTGTFDWDWLARTGRADLHSTLTFQGENMALSALADWDASLLEAKGLEFSVAGSSLRLSGGLRLDGLQFWQMGKLGVKDVRDLALEANRFDASRLSALFGNAYPVERGILNGRLAYADSSGFSGEYEAADLDLAPIRKLAAIHRLTLRGRGESLLLGMRTGSPIHPWLNDTVTLELAGLSGRNPAVRLRVVSDEGLTVSFRGQAPGFRALEGAFAVDGKTSLPGQGGEIRDIRIEGRVAAPIAKDVLKRMILDSGSFRGRYAIPGLDTQAFSGSMSLRDGRLRIPDLRSENAGGLSLTGEAEYDFGGPPVLAARIRGRNLALQWPGVQKLVLSDADASMRMDASGLAAEASLGKVEFGVAKPPINVRGNLENVTVSYRRSGRSREPANASAAEGSIPTLKVKARMRDFLFRHKIGFRELQRSIRAVKSDKRRKRVKPMDMQIDLEAVGTGNRIETDILRMAFLGDVSVKGVYPYTLVTGEFSALKGELGQTGQSYDITDFGLKWQNATLEEGRVSVEGSKRLRSDCKPDTRRTCNVYVKLSGRLDEMSFTYDSDCGGNTGETIEPTALINSVSRGCYSDEYVAGAGGGNYGEAVFTMLEPAINERLSKVGSRFSGGWLKSTQVTGIGTMVSGDTVSAEPIAIGVESKEKWGMSVKARAGYHPEKKQPTTWENRVSLEWRPPLEKVSDDAGWKRRVRDRVTLEASAENRPEEKLNEESREVRKQVGIRYRFKFWNLW